MDLNHPARFILVNELDWMSQMSPSLMCYFAFAHNLIHCQTVCWLGGMDGKSVYLWALIDSFSTPCPVLLGICNIVARCVSFLYSVENRPLWSSLSIFALLLRRFQKWVRQRTCNKEQIVCSRVIRRSCAAPDLELLLLIKYSLSHTHRQTHCFCALQFKYWYNKSLFKQL